MNFISNIKGFFIKKAPNVKLLPQNSYHIKSTENLASLSKDIFVKPETRLIARLSSFDAKKTSEIFNSCNFSPEEKTHFALLYKHIQDLGYRDFIETHPNVFTGMAISVCCSESGVNYAKIEKEEFEIIKYAIEQLESGKIKPEWIKGAAARQNDPVFYTWYKYYDDYSAIPEEGLPNIYDPECNISKDIIVGALKDEKALSQCIKAQSIPNAIQVQRADKNFDIFNNVAKNEANLGELMNSKNPKDIQKALELLNDKKTSAEVYFKNSIGTSLECGHFEKRRYDAPINWNIDVPKGSKGIFLPAITTSTYHEAEFLLQRGTTLKIEGAQYVNGKWFIKAKALQDF